MNDNVSKTLDEAVQEVLGLLTGLDLTYRPEYDRYRAITMQLNRALRMNALEAEWAHYSSTEDLGIAHAGDREVDLRASVRLRIINDDAVRLVDDTGRTRVWAYILPRDALHKYEGRREGLWVAYTRSTLEFSKPLGLEHDGLRILVPVMREPEQFRLPASPEDPNDPSEDVSLDVREQLVDFDYPDVIIAKAAYLYAQSDPVMQPRVQTLEAQAKDIMYQLIERDDRHTDTPYQNDFFVPIMNDIRGSSALFMPHGHPHADGRI